ncbi:MAG TPA: MFS transporter [Verrucomicrobiae bacterium]
MHETESQEDPTLSPTIPPAADHPYAVFRNADYVRYLIARFIAALGMQMLVTALDWELYKRAQSGLALGFVGLSLMVPMVLCTLPAGQLADRRNRKSIILGATLLLALASLGLTLTSAFIALGRNVATFQLFAYSLLVVIGVSRTFLWPASAAFVTALVSREALPRAITFNSGAFQFACVLGPTLAGVIIWLTHGAWLVYAVNVLAGLVCFGLVAGIRHEHKVPPREPVSLKSLITGFQFVYHNKIILGTITLDMFAVLLGGAVTLLPIYAADILPLNGGAGGLGLGILRAAIPIGAVICMFIIAHRPPLQKAGRAMLVCVGIFGVATILFGLANRQCLGRFLPAPDAAWFWAAFGLLAVCGAVDNVSVIVRQTLVQILTPDEKRGRVSAVNSLFIGTSNELGGTESGFTAQWFGPVMYGVSESSPAYAHAMATGAIWSTEVGGFGTLVVVLAVAWIWPEIRRYGKLA